MIERDHPDLSIGQQCELLSIPRSSFYYLPQGETEQNLALMRLIDVQFLDTPFFGVRQMTWHLRNDGHAVNEKRIRRLMRLMGLMPIYKKPQHQQADERAQDLPLSAARAACGQAKPGLVRGHHLSADASRVPLSGGNHGLAYPDGSIVADIEHAGDRLLRRSAERGDLSVRTTGHHEQRSRISVHILRLDRPPTPVRHQHLNGRQGSLSGQHLH